MALNNDGKQFDSSSASATGQIELQIRTARMQKNIKVDETTSIKDLRTKTAELFEVGDPALTVLIFGGKILKDTEDIKTHSIKDGQTIHLVIRNNPTTNNSNSVTSANLNQSVNTQATNVSNTTSDNTNVPNIRQDASAIPMLGNLNDIQQRLAQMLISNPDAMQNIINPTMQQMMANPNMMRSLFGSMQRMQMLMERNPEVNHLLSNPDVLRESLEMVRNPAALQEVMRNYDRALNNMESMPGGYNVLRRMYTEFQEPLLSAFQEQFSTNQFSPQSNTDNNNESNRDASGNEQQRTENRDPLPNPWAAPTAGANRPQFPTAVNDSLIGGNLEGQDNLNTNDLLQRANSMFQDQEFMSLLTNPEAIQSVEQIQQGFERLQRIAPNLFGRLVLPSLPRTNTDSGNSDNTTTNQSTGGQSLMAGELANLGNISQLFRQLLGGAAANERGASNLEHGNTDITNNNNALTTNLPQQNLATDVGTDQQSAEAARLLVQMLGGQGGGAGLGSGVGGLGNLANLANPINSGSGGVGGPPPEERYSQQLQQLSEMGFTNREANLRALVATFGDINAAIARLLPQ